MWLKIKVWTKVVVFGLLTLSVLIFLINNVNKQVTFWLWNDIQTTLLKFFFVTVLISVLATILVRTTWTTVRQLQELRRRGREERMQRDLADMKSKAAMLQTRVKTATTPAPPPQELPED